MTPHKPANTAITLAAFIAALWLACAMSGCGQSVDALEETYTTQIGLKFCSCHDAKGDNVKAKALAIFDLRKPGWIKDLPEERLDAFIERNKKGTSQDTQALSRQLVEAERQRRNQ